MLIGPSITPMREYFSDRDPNEVIITKGEEEGSIMLGQPAWTDIFSSRFDIDSCCLLVEIVKSKFIGKAYSKDEALSILRKLREAVLTNNLHIPEILEQTIFFVEEQNDYLTSRQTYITFHGDIDSFLTRKLDHKASELFRNIIAQNFPNDEVAKELFREQVTSALEENGAKHNEHFQNTQLCTEHDKTEAMAMNFFEEWMTRIVNRKNEASSSTSQPQASSSTDQPALNLLEIWSSHTNEARKQWTELVMSEGSQILNWQRLLEAALDNNNRGYCEVFWNEFIQIFAHQWGIDLDIKRASSKREQTTGYYPEYMQLQMAYWLQKYLENLPETDCTAASSSSSSSTAPQNPWDLLREMGPDLVEAYKKAALYASDQCNEDSLKQLVEDFRQDKPVVIATGWHRHAVEILFLPKAKFVAYVNRGDRSAEIGSGFRLFAMNDKEETLAQLEKMLLGPNKSDRDWIVDKNKICSEDGKRLLENTLYQDNIFTRLKLKKWVKIPLSDQKVGNCTWANTVGTLPAALLMAIYGQDPANMKSNEIADLVFPVSKDFGAFCRVESAKLFTKLYRRYVESGRRNELQDKEQFKLMSTLVYKSLLKLHNSDFSSDRLDQLKAVIDSHFSEYEYAMEDCVTPLNRQQATALLHYLPVGSFLFRKSDYEKNCYAISYRANDEVKHALVVDNGSLTYEKGRYSLHNLIPCNALDPNRRLNRSLAKRAYQDFHISDEIGRFSSLSHLFKEKQLSFPVSADSSERLRAVERIYHEATNKKAYTQEEIEQAFSKRSRNAQLAYLNILSDREAILYTSTRRNKLDKLSLKVSPKGSWVDKNGKALRSKDRKKDRLKARHDLLRLLPEGYNWLYMDNSLRQPYTSLQPAYGADIEL